jgi:serine/threonine protein kinase
MRNFSAGETLQFDHEDQASNRFGEYEIVCKLGEGGMGSVFKVRGTDGAIYALKVLREDLAKETIFAERFLREAKMAMRLQHENIVRTHHVGVGPENTLYILSDFCAGGSADVYLDRSEAFPVEWALRWMRDLGRALDYAWTQQSIIHRDIKPENFLVDGNGHILLGDMGLARSTSQDATLMTVEGAVMGSACYMSPEQAQGHMDLDIRTDLYALGASFYHLLSKRPLFDGPTVAHIIRAQVCELPVQLAVDRPDLPGAVCAIIHWLL